MLTLEPPSTATTTTTQAGMYLLRVHGGTDDQPPLRIPPGKHSLGSGPRCSLRLSADGVQPLECLLVRDRNGLGVRRWSDSVRLNGEAFDEARLTAGDLLTLGPVTLEVVAPTDDATAGDELAGLTTDAWDPASETARRIAASLASRRGRVVGRPTAGTISAAQPQASSDEHGMSVAAPPTSDRIDELELRAQQLAGELELVRAELTAREGELAHARYSIEVLEQQLIDSQHTMHAMTDERLKWGEQFDELESRLAEYVQRIQGLERQLEDVRSLRNDASAVAAELDETGDAVEPSCAIGTEDLASNESAAEAAVPPDVAAGPATDWQQQVDVSSADNVGHDAETVVAATEDATASEPVAEGDPAQPAHGLSLWQQESAVAAEVSSVPELDESAGGEADKPEFTAPPSFIDRYVHLFSAEETDTTPPATRPQPIPAESPAADADRDHENTESVEQYMAKLLERMRGKPSSSSTSSTASEAPSAAEAVAPAAEDQVSPEGDSCVWPTNLVKDLAEIRSRPAAPESTSNLEAMREVANRSTRQAIGIHTARALRRTAMTQLIVALVGAAASAFLMLGASRWLGLRFITGCVAAFIVVYWGKLTLSTFLEGVRVGAFDDEVEPQHAEQPPLPSDVEQPSDEISTAAQAAVDERQA